MNTSVQLKSDSLTDRFFEYLPYCFQKGTSFVLDGNNEQAIKTILTTIERNEKGVLVVGQPESGKTLVMRIIQRITHPQSSFFFKKTTAIDTVIDFNVDGSEILRRNEKDNVFYDDLGTEDMGVHYGNRIETFDRVIQKRYELFQFGGIKTHFTTNLTWEAIKNRYGLRIDSRLNAMCETVIMNTGGRRSLKGFVGLPQVIHKRIMSPEDIEWEKQYYENKKSRQMGPHPQYAEGIGSQLRKVIG